MRIGEILVELGYLTEGDLEETFRIQKKEGRKRKLGEVLIEHNFIEERKLIDVLSMQMGFPFVEPQFADIDPDIYHLVPYGWYDDHAMIPIRKEGDQTLIAFADPLDTVEFGAAQMFFGTKLLPAIALPGSTREAIKRMERNRTEGSNNHFEANHVIDTVNEIIGTAIVENVSDIHLEPMPDRLRVRFRHDGVLIHHKDFNKNLIPPLTSRIKIMCQADIAEKRRHQGGRIVFNEAGNEADLRASFYVTINREKIVLRILKQQSHLVKIEDLGMAPTVFERFREEALDRPSGVVMITGPTGSGKTTAVYSCINYLNDPMTSIITAEDPVEYVVEGIAQCSINPKLDLTYEETLRHIVRQDPDVVVIGEIRDRFSAEVAVQAALTGHKVVTTFHTEDSIGGLIRLMNMDIEAFLVSSTVVSVIAQRLLRKPCPLCEAPDNPNLTILRRWGYTPEDVKDTDFRKGRGCAKYRYTGYQGRIAVVEMLLLDEYMRNALINHSTSHQIRRISIEKSGLITLLEAGIIKASQGKTTIPRMETIF